MIPPKVEKSFVFLRGKYGCFFLRYPFSAWLAGKPTGKNTALEGTLKEDTPIFYKLPLMTTTNTPKPSGHV